MELPDKELAKVIRYPFPKDIAFSFGNLGTALYCIAP